MISVGENRTKLQLDQALRTLLREKGPEQIRVRELTELCGIRRQSFYYHFTDVFDLLRWSVDRTASLLEARQEGCLTWQQAFRDLLDCLSENRAYCLAVRGALGREGLRRMLGGPVDRLLERTAAYYKPRCGFSGGGDPDAIPCAGAMVLGLLDGWLSGDLAESPEALTAQLERAVDRRQLGELWRNYPNWGAVSIP